ncbi:MAG: hypothetical protein AAF975_09350, partial [Spirochaetota bacterium]
PEDISAIPSPIPMGFCILEFPYQKGLPRSKQNQHPLSIFRLLRENEGVEMEFALEMQGFLAYLPSNAFRGEIRVWGPYYDTLPEQLRFIAEQGKLLYIGMDSGFSPLNQYLELLPGYKPAHIFIVYLETPHTPKYWYQNLKAQQRKPHIHIELKRLSVSPRIANDMNDISPVKASKKQSLRKRRFIGEWQRFILEREAQVLEQKLSDSLAELSRKWGSTELEAYHIYRGPRSIAPIIKKCLDNQRATVSSNE